MRNISFRLFGLAVCAGFVLGSTAAGDTVRLRGGRELRGVLAGPGGDPVSLQTVSGVVRIPRGQIERIELDSDGVNQLLLAEFQIRCGNAREAEQHARKALEAGVARSQVRDLLLRLDVFVGQALRGAEDPKARGAWVSLVRGISGFPVPAEGGDPDRFTAPTWARAGDSELGERLRSASAAGPGSEFCLRMARVFASAGEGGFALELLEHLDLDAWKSAAGSEDFVRTVSLEQLRRILGEYDFERASALVQRLEAADFGVGDASRVLLALRWAAFERSRSRYDGALSVLDAHLRPLSSSLAEDRLSATLLDARRDLARQGRFSEAISLYRKWSGKIRGENTREGEAALYREWGLFLLGQNDPGKARAAFEFYYQLAPPAEGSGRRLLDLCDFRERFLSLRRGDFSFAFELGQWAADRELLEEAIRAFERAAEYEGLRAAADREIGAVRKRMALAYLEECMALYEGEDPAGAIRKMELFRNFPKDAETEERFLRLRQLCAREIQRRSSLRTVQAETLLEDARRRFLLGRDEDVLRDLVFLLRQYGDTPSAGAAEVLLKQAEMRQNLERLEGVSGGDRDLGSPEPRMAREIGEILKALEIPGVDRGD